MQHVASPALVRSEQPSRLLCGTTALFSFISFSPIYVVRTKQVEAEGTLITTNFIAYKSMELLHHVLDHRETMSRMLRIPNILHFAGIFPEVVERYVARGVQLSQCGRIAVFLGAEPAHELVAAIDHGTEERSLGEIGRTEFLANMAQLGCLRYPRIGLRVG